MDQINAVIDCDVARLDFPLRPWKARVAHNFVALFRRVPADVTGLFVRLFKADGSYFDVTAHEHADGILVPRASPQSWTASTRCMPTRQTTSPPRSARGG